ncbi:MAG: FG-GAP-like repeat-containing protein [Bacteroidota bacterium]
MNRIIRCIFSIISAVLLTTNVFAQKPIVRNVDPNAGAFGETAVITGQNFNTNVSNNAVYFGAAPARIISATDQIIEAQIPAGASYNRVSVANLSNGRIGYSRDQFTLSYGGETGLTAADFESQADFFAQRGLFDLCMCDLDGDSLVDVTTANDNDNRLSVFRNTSTAGNISFLKLAPFLGTPTINVTCGDIDGDGRPDLVASEGDDGDRIFIFRNTSTVGTISFSSQIITAPAGSITRRIEINDLDNDGRPELILTNQGNNSILILVNQSTVGNINFAPTIREIIIPGTSSTAGLAVEDLNGDFRPEIVVNQFLTDGGQCFVLVNSSTPGNFQLNNILTLNVTGTLVNVRVGDLDGDGRPDIAATQLLGSDISIFRNTTSSVGAIPSFDAPEDVTTNIRPWGLDFGDLDGDGLIDVVVAGIGGPLITVLENFSSAGNLNFNRVNIPVSFISRNTKIADLDGDAKPEIAYTSIDDNNNAILSSNLSVLRNRNCIIASITADGPLNVCSDRQLRLMANKGAGFTYQWRIDGVVQPETDDFFEPTVSGSYTVTITSEGGSCVSTSDPANILLSSGTTPSTFAASNNGPVCTGATLQLSAPNIPGGTYEWTGPDGFTSALQNPTISNFATANVGRYEVVVTVGGCPSEPAETFVQIIDAPTFFLSSSGPTTFCQGKNTILSVQNEPNYGYQWLRDGGILSGETNSTLTVTQTGDYTVRIEDQVNACPDITPDPIAVTVVPPPTASFNAPPEVCIGDVVTFTNTSTVIGGVAVFYSWDFGGQGTSTSDSPTQTFNTAGQFDVTLMVSYEDSDCNDTFVQSILVTDNPAITITTATGSNFFCSGDSLLLEAPAGFARYTWSTGDEASSIFVDLPDTYTVDVETSSGCAAMAQIQLDTFPKPSVTIQVENPRIEKGQEIALLATGLQNYQWQPPDGLSATNIPDPVALIEQSITYTVTGTDINGCVGTASIELFAENLPLTARKLFSPNNDGIDDTWQIDNIVDRPACAVTIFDQKGITLFEAQPYLNNWDATLNGTPLPRGVYYFTINCQDDGNQVSGSITVVR